MWQVLKSAAKLFSSAPQPAEAANSALSREHRAIDSQEWITSAERLAQVLNEHRVNPDVLKNGTLHGIFSLEGGRLQCQMVEGVSIVLIKFQGHPKPRDLQLTTFEEPPAPAETGASSQSAQPELKLVEKSLPILVMMSGGLAGYGHINVGNYDRLIRDPLGHVVLCYIGGKSTVLMKTERDAKNAPPDAAPTQ